MIPIHSRRTWPSSLSWSATRNPLWPVTGTCWRSSLKFDSPSAHLRGVGNDRAKITSSSVDNLCCLVAKSCLLKNAIKIQQIQWNSLKLCDATWCNRCFDSAPIHAAKAKNIFHQHTVSTLDAPRVSEQSLGVPCTRSSFHLPPAKIRKALHGGFWKVRLQFLQHRMAQNFTVWCLEGFHHVEDLRRS